MKALVAYLIASAIAGFIARKNSPEAAKAMDHAMDQYFHENILVPLLKTLEPPKKEKK